MNKTKRSATRTNNRESPRDGDRQFSFDGLNRVIHEKARLGILTSLAGHADGVLFNDLKHLCRLTDGNLNRHLNVLIEANMVEVWTSGSGSRRQSLYRLTGEGREAFIGYLKVLETVVEQAQASVNNADETPAAGAPS